MDIFEKCVCISLLRRLDRYTQFKQQLVGDWLFKEVEKYEAIDGRNCYPPFNWKRSSGAWGCFKSHLNVLENCLSSNIKSILIMEDDAVLCEQFSDKVLSFLDAVPNNWEIIYFGGEHLSVPIKINDVVVVPTKLKRTHCYAVRYNAISVIYEYLCNYGYDDEVDIKLWDCIVENKLNVYSPYPIWLVSQSNSSSDIVGSNIVGSNIIGSNIVGSNIVGSNIIGQVNLPDCTVE